VPAAGQRQRRIVLAPDLVTDSEEIRMRGQSLDQVQRQPALGHHRHFDHLRPPCEKIQFGLRGTAQRRVATGAKGHVVCPQLARRHPVVLGRGTKRADDGILAQRLARLFHATGSIGQVDAVQPQPRDKPRMRLDHQRHITRCRHFAQGIDRPDQPVFVAGAQCEPHAGYVLRVETGCQLVGIDGKVELGRADQVKLRVVGGIVGHDGPQAGLRVSL